MVRPTEIRVWFRSLLRLAFWTFLASGPVFFVVSAFLYGWDYRWRPDGGIHYGPYFIAYTLLMPIVFIIALIKNWRKAIFFFGASILAVGLVIVLPITHFLAAAGFYCAIYPQNSYIQKHCHPVSFRQDGRVYAWGACDGQIGADGQTIINVVYDTSGDTLYDGVHDRKEWVNAVRKFYNDDPNEELEVFSGDTWRIYGPFYFLWFEDEGGGEGFSNAFGPPPANKKNHFRRDVY